jgi:hypothetical protein
MPQAACAAPKVTNASTATAPRPSKNRRMVPLPRCLVKSLIVVYNTSMANMFGKNNAKYSKIFGAALAVIIILSMVFSYFSLLF